MHRQRRWMAVVGALLLCGWGGACLDSDEAPSAKERQARSDVLRNLLASRERMPAPEELDAQRRDLQVEVGQGEAVAQGGSGREQPTASITGTVEWVGDDELLFRDAAGVERDVYIQEDTRFLREGREVSRRSVEPGTEIRVAYDVEQGEWQARQVELLGDPAPAPRDEGRGERSTSRPSQR